MLGWLLFCDPPEQSAGQIADAIGASQASLTTNLRLLGSVGFVSQVTKPGDRTVYYRVDDDAWESVVRRQIASLASFGDIMRDGLSLTGRSTRRSSRIRADHVRLVSVDFETDDLMESLAANCFQLDQPTMVVWEAVTQYLTEDGVRRTLALLGKAATGSRLVCTFVGRDLPVSEIERFVLATKPWHVTAQDSGQRSFPAGAPLRRRRPRSGSADRAGRPRWRSRCR